MSDSYQIALDFLNKEAEARRKRNCEKPSERPLSDNYHLVGMVGEWEFGKLCGKMPDFAVKDFGDGGCDFVVSLRFTVDVKTTRGNRLLLEKGKPLADIYVLAKYDDETSTAKILGWEWGKILQAQPPFDTGRGIINHCLEAVKLRPIDELINIMD
jgi:hypothetical protein